MFLRKGKKEDEISEWAQEMLTWALRWKRGGEERMRGRKREWRLEVEGGVQTSSIFSLPTPAFHLPPRGSDSALQNST